MNHDDELRRRDAIARYNAGVQRARERFARGVERSRAATPTILCAGCAKLLTPAELAGVTPFGPLCAECHAGID